MTNKKNPNEPGKRDHPSWRFSEDPSDVPTKEGEEAAQRLLEQLEHDLAAEEAAKK